MGRRTILQILNEAKVVLPKEYDRLYELFCEREYQHNFGNKKTLRNHCAEYFMSNPIRGTCVSLSDFEQTYGFRFAKNSPVLIPAEKHLDLLLYFCEYSYNLSYYSQQIVVKNLYTPVSTMDYHPIKDYLQQVLTVIDKIGYMPIMSDGITSFVPKDQVAISVAGTLDSTLSYRLIDYNHHSMKGDIKRKRETLLALADKLEAEEKKLKQINAPLADDLFFMLNNLDIRHNNRGEGGKNYKPFVAIMAPEELEKWYDEVYQVCLLAFMELEHSQRKRAIAELKKNINTK